MGLVAKKVVLNLVRFAMAVCVASSGLMLMGINPVNKTTIVVNLLTLIIWVTSEYDNYKR